MQTNLEVTDLQMYIEPNLEYNVLNVAYLESF